jgi:hypothetical protein
MCLPAGKKMKTRGIYLDTYNCPYCKNTIETIVHLFVQCPYLDKFRKLIKDLIKADLHVDKFSMDIQNIILYNVKFKYYPYVFHHRAFFFFTNIYFIEKFQILHIVIFFK